MSELPDTAPQSGNSPVALTVILASLALLIVTCLVSLMHSFMRGSAPANDFAELYTLQSVGIAFSLAAALASLLYFSADTNLAEGLRRLWANLPGWLIFGIFVINLLVFVGELSYFIIFMGGTMLDEWSNHVALLCLTFSSLAYGMVYAARNASDGRPRFDKSRW